MSSSQQVKIKDTSLNKTGRISPSPKQREGFYNKSGRNSPKKNQHLDLSQLDLQQKQSPENYNKSIKIYPSNSKFQFSMTKKQNSIKPILTLKELETEIDFIDRTSSNSISPIPMELSMSMNSNTNTSSPRLTRTLTHSPSISHSPSPNPIPIPLNTHLSTSANSDKNIVKPIAKHMSLMPITLNTCNPYTIYNYKYYYHLQLIAILKNLVFNNASLICGSFNSQQLLIDEYTKAFLLNIKDYEIINNIIFTNQQIDDLFTNENIYPETIHRLGLQNMMHILTTTVKFNSFINSISIHMSNYKIEHINSSNITNILLSNFQSNLQNKYIDSSSNEIFLNIIKITIPEYNIVFEVHFIILENEKRKIDKLYEIPLVIPMGLYNLEHLFITNNGCDKLSIQYSSSQIEYIINNLTMKITSLMPKYIENEYDYAKIVKYVLYMIKNDNKHNSYMFEFDFFNNMSSIIHKKSDFWVTNKVPKLSTDNSISTSTSKSTTSNTSNTTMHCCHKCSIKISKNSTYVIPKCCNNSYHIECMEMNYSEKDFYTYFMCDCSSVSIDDNSNNQKLLLALYKSTCI